MYWKSNQYLYANGQTYVNMQKRAEKNHIVLLYSSYLWIITVEREVEREEVNMLVIYFVKIGRNSFALFFKLPFYFICNKKIISVTLSIIFVSLCDDFSTPVCSCHLGYAFNRGSQSWALK